MDLNELNDVILNEYMVQVEKHDIDSEVLIKSIACIALQLFEVAGVDNVSVDGNKLVLVNE